MDKKYLMTVGRIIAQEGPLSPSQIAHFCKKWLVTNPTDITIVTKAYEQAPPSQRQS